MSHLLPPWPTLSAFIVASVVLAVTPGPAVFYIVSRSLLQGRRHGLVSVLGIAIGNFGNALAASLGLAALFAVSSLAFAIVKYAGAAYLIHVGVKMLRTAGAASSSAPPAAAPLGRAFRDGIVVSLFNPKTTLFFAAFLPQFVHAPDSPLQAVVLGALFVLVASISDSAYALAAGTVSRSLAGSRAGSIGQRFGGGMFIGLGLFTALSGSRAGK